MNSGEISPETIETVRDRRHWFWQEQVFCPHTNMSYYENALVHCTLPATHIKNGEEHWGVEVNGTERGWDL